MMQNPFKGLIQPLVQLELSIAQAASPILQPLNVSPPVGPLTTIDRSLGNGVPGVTGFDPIGQLLRSIGIGGVGPTAAPAPAPTLPPPLGGVRVAPQPLTGTASLTPAGVGTTRRGIG